MFFFFFFNNCNICFFKCVNQPLPLFPDCIRGLQRSQPCCFIWKSDQLLDFPHIHLYINTLSAAFFSTKRKSHNLQFFNLWAFRCTLHADIQNNPVKHKVCYLNVLIKEFGPSPDPEKYCLDFINQCCSSFMPVVINSLLNSKAIIVMVVKIKFGCIDTHGRLIKETSLCIY